MYVFESHTIYYANHICMYIKEIICMHTSRVVVCVVDCGLHIELRVWRASLSVRDSGYETVALFQVWCVYQSIYMGVNLSIYHIHVVYLSNT